MTSVETIKFKRTLEKCFATDQALLDKWHIFSGRGLEACVNKTFRDLCELRVRFFKVYDENKFTGYFAEERFNDKKYLTGFFLMPEFRNKEKKAEYWAHIKKHFGPTFFCGLYQKNIPANKFIQSQGGKAVLRASITDGDAIMYKLGE